MRLAIVTVVALALSAVATGAVSAPYSARATSTCLMSHMVLANPVSKTQVLPPHYLAGSVLQFSFALIPAQSLDHGNVIFEKDATTAKRVGAAWFAYSVKQAARVQGIDQAQAKQLIREALSVKGNAIVSWVNYPVKPASRRLLASCLR